ncbi:putative autophagy-related protein 3 [Paratrimastix pyriformis]|uniref:Autophagy-related protein 3 n=1 Tax=Paratrimastix pyriformis TaxID=342808 RepID=A0ABQ8UVC1_9EUKA|nr:putative autophagy-related protein 3 [Paratrimastix pyriformis]
MEALKNLFRKNKSIPTENTFERDGKITPDQFVAAGDQLIDKCPAWRWAAGEPSKALQYLPPGKQFLITQRVPCRKRASSLLTRAEESEVEGDGGDSWLVPESAVATPDAATPASGAAAAGGAAHRTYDVCITYDIFYQSPRMWLLGYAEDGTTLLTQEQVFEDISEDHARKTVTIEQHPHLGVPYATIHPCKHASLMKRFIDRLAQENKGLNPTHYFFQFLKFMNAVIPTIEYGMTVEMESL